MYYWAWTTAFFFSVSFLSSGMMDAEAGLLPLGLHREHATGSRLPRDTTASW